jgi:hypothetical protein
VLANKIGPSDSAMHSIVTNVVAIMYFSTVVDDSCLMERRKFFPAQEIGSNKSVISEIDPFFSGLP